MLRNTQLYENVLFIYKVKVASISVGKGKEVALIKRVKSTLEFAETLGVAFH